MQTFRHVLCADDCDEATLPALAVALSIASAYEARFTHFSCEGTYSESAVMEFGDVGNGLGALLVEGIELRKSDCRRELEARRKRVVDAALIRPPDETIDLAEFGSPETALSQILSASINPIDIIVMGHSHHTNIYDWFVGSLMRSALMDGRVAVLVVPMGEIPTRSWKPDRILLAVTQPGNGGRAEEAALSFARTLGQNVTLLHVIEPESPGPDFDDVVDSRTFSLNSRVDFLKQDHSTLVNGVVRLGKPSEMIAETAREMCVDLVVLGRRQEKGVGRTVRAILKELHTAPLLILPYAIAETT